MGGAVTQVAGDLWGVATAALDTVGDTITTVADDLWGAFWPK